MGASMPKDFRKGTPSSQFKARLRAGFIKWVSAPATARDAAESMEFLAWLARDGKLDSRPLRSVSAAFFAFFTLEYMGYATPKISKLAEWSGSHPRGVRIQLSFLCDQFTRFLQHRILIRCSTQGWKCFSTPSVIGLSQGLRRKSAPLLRREVKGAFSMEMTWAESFLVREGDEKAPEATRIPAAQFRPKWGSSYSITRAQRTPEALRSSPMKKIVEVPEKPALSRAKDSTSDFPVVPSSTGSSPAQRAPSPLASLLDSRASRSSDSICSRHSETEKALSSESETNASSSANASSSNTSAISSSSRGSFRVVVLDPPIDINFLPDELFDAFLMFDNCVFHHLDYIGSQISPGDSIYYSSAEKRGFVRTSSELEEAKTQV